MTGHLTEIALVALGGALGGSARFALSGAVARRWGEAFPWGTLVVNVTGAALIGALAGLIAPGPGAAPSLWLLLVVGVLGSYTTVSSFSLQTMALARGGQIGAALANVAASVGLCLAACALGLWAARIWVG